MSYLIESRERSQKLFEQISTWVPGGETSYARQMSGHPIVVASSQGPYLYDEDGNRYIDYCGGYGVNLFGHNPPWLVEAVVDTIRHMGPHFSFPHRLYAEVGQRIAALLPSIEQVRFANSGTEAVMAAIRLARAATGRDLVVKFEGAYHGWADPIYAGSSAAAGGGWIRPPDSEGVPASAVAQILICPFNDLASLNQIFDAQGDRIAAILVEPVLGSGGQLKPQPGFLEALRALTTRHQALLIFDEVMTGFRLAAGGAQAFFGLKPDLTVLGKILGGGFAMAAFGGSRELMRPVAEGRAVHGGTYSGSPTVLAAARAVLDRIIELGPALYEDLERRTRHLAQGLEAAMQEAGLVGHVRQVASMLLPVLGTANSDQARSVADISACQDQAQFRRFCDELSRRGVFAHRYPLGRWFLSTTHTDEVLADTLARANEALWAMREGGEDGG